MITLSNQISDIIYHSGKQQYKDGYNLYKDDKIELRNNENGHTVILSNGVTVYFCPYNDEPKIFRPGFWLTYLTALHDKVQKDIEIQKIVNFSPIDDSDIFMDI